MDRGFTRGTCYGFKTPRNLTERKLLLMVPHDKGAKDIGRTGKEPYYNRIGMCVGLTTRYSIAIHYIE